MAKTTESLPTVSVQYIKALSTADLEAVEQAGERLFDRYAALDDEPDPDLDRDEGR